MQNPSDENKIKYFEMIADVWKGQTTDPTKQHNSLKNNAMNQIIKLTATK